ncbi:MAG: sulfatase-like hydrolase/transferase [Rikenellaceae bacterium]
MKSEIPTVLNVGVGVCLLAPLALSAASKRPNVLVILADDLGKGDVGVYGSEAIKTPNLDKLANEGVCFNNGYATSATSTPSRYALFTGMYPWKNKNAQILPGDAPLLISTTQYTLPKMMQEAGYKTGAIGKWHLGMGAGDLDWNTKISPCANDIGFDYSCLIAATNDRVPTVYVENGLVEGLDPADPIYVNYKKNYEGEPTAHSNPEMLKMMWAHGHNNSIVNGIPRIGFQTGGKAAHWVDEDMADYFVDKVKRFVDENKDEPFFLYYGLHQPHVPRAPHSRFVGATDLGPRGDAIVEADWCVGEVIDYLDKMGVLENTIIIFSSDNGPVLNDGYKDQAIDNASKHNQLGDRRGGKYSKFEGGTNVPFFVYWKGEIRPAKSEALVCQIDIMPSLAKLLKLDIPEIDGEEQWKALIGKDKVGRSELVHEANKNLSYRSGKWALIPATNNKKTNMAGNEPGFFAEITLWDLDVDPAQRTDVAAQYPEVVEKLYAEFKEITKGYYKEEVIK